MLKNLGGMERINVKEIEDAFLVSYPSELLHFATHNQLTLPSLQSGNGKALSAMAHNPMKYWVRADCEEFVAKYGIKTADSIQLFNKKEQVGFKTSSERGKNYLVSPLTLSNKYAMRKGFAFDGTAQQRDIEINKIKSTITHDYIDVPNDQWQLGHKNPDTTDNSQKNLVLQPPIQAKYRDNYIFIDTLTKLPTPSKMLADIKSGKSPYTREQIVALRDGLNSL